MKPIKDIQQHIYAFVPFLMIGSVFLLISPFVYMRVREIWYDKLPVIVESNIHYKIDSEDKEAYAVGLDEVCTQHLVLPDSFKYEGACYTVVGIADSAFKHRTDIQRVTLPNSIRVIGCQAFAHTGLRSVVIPNGVEEIGGCAFAYNDFLTEFVVDDGITELLARGGRGIV